MKYSLITNVKNNMVSYPNKLTAGKNHAKHFQNFVPGNAKVEVCIDHDRGRISFNCKALGKSRVYRI